MLGPDGGSLAIESDGVTAGRVDWFPGFWGRSTSRCWSIAIVLAPGHRSHGIGSVAQKLLVDYLFNHTREERIQAFTDTENIAERRALEKAGFELEGIIRRAQWRAGCWHDMALYSILGPHTQTMAAP